MLPKWLNQNSEIWLRTAPLCGIGSGRITSKAEMRSVATKSSVSPSSNTSRTLPLRSFLIPGRSIEVSVAACMDKYSTFNRHLSTSLLFGHFERSPEGFWQSSGWRGDFTEGRQGSSDWERHLQLEITNRSSPFLAATAGSRL